MDESPYERFKKQQDESEKRIFRQNIEQLSKKNDHNKSSNSGAWYNNAIIVGIIVTVIGGLILWAIIG